MRVVPAWIALVFLAGCTAGIRLEAWKPGSPLTKGVVYRLPRSVVEVTIPYVKVRKTTWAADVQGRAVKKDAKGELVKPVSVVEVIRIDKPIVVRTLSVPDDNLAFLVDADDLFSFSTAVEGARLELTADGVLTEANATYRDRTGDIVGSVLKAGVSVAKIFAVAGNLAVEEEVVKDMTVTRILEVGTDFKAGAAAGTFEYEDRDYAEAQTGDAGFPRVVVRLATPSAILAADRVRAADVIPSDGGLPGIVFRVPAPVRLSILVDDAEQARSIVSLTQAGDLAWIPVESKALSDRTAGLRLSPVTGGVTAYAWGGSATGEEAADLLRSSAGEVDPALRALEIERKKAEIERLRVEIDLIEEQKKRRAIEEK